MGITHSAASIAASISCKHSCTLQHDRSKLVNNSSQARYGKGREAV